MFAGGFEVLASRLADFEMVETSGGAREFFRSWLG